jgi:hypothetical protein
VSPIPSPFATRNSLATIPLNPRDLRHREELPGLERHEARLVLLKPLHAERINLNRLDRDRRNALHKRHRLERLSRLRREVQSRHKRIRERDLPDPVAL